MPEKELYQQEESTFQKGREYERLARNYLVQRDFQMIESNFRCRQGEIDIIARRGKEYHFIEVKGQHRDWQAELKINSKKQRRIWNASMYYVQKNKLLGKYSFHYDVMIVTSQTVKYYENAFEG